MQVTNHRFADGVLGTVQSVLQEGTAVLVDADGTPRVRCACGNPLAPAAYTSDEDTDNEYVGEPWDGFTYDDDADDDSDAKAAAFNDDDHDWDRPAADDCRRGEFRDDDGNCVRHCPRGTWRDDDGRCRAPIDRCDVKDHEKPDWCKPRPGCTPPSRPDAPVATDSDRHGPPCHPQCPDGKKSRDDRCGSPPDCPSAAEAISDNAEKTRHCQPPPSHPQPCADGKACPGEPPVKDKDDKDDKDNKDPIKDPAVCQVVGTVTSTLNNVVAPGTEAKPCTEPEKAKAGAEGTPESPEGTPPVDKKPTDAVPPATENGQNPPVVPSVPDVVEKVLPPPAGDQPPTPPKADPPANTDPGAKPAPKPAEEPKPAEQPKPADPPPAAEGKADPPLPAVVKPLPIVGSKPETKPAPAPEQAPPVVAPAPKKAAPEPSPSPAAKPAPKKPAVPDPVAIVVPKKEPAAAPAAQPAPAPKPAPKPSPKPAAKPAPAAGPACPNGTAMPAAGCTIPASGVPAGWVKQGARMVPA